MDEQYQKIIMDSDIVTVSDIETTGFSPNKGASIIEIGSVKVDVKNKCIIGVYSTYVHPLYGKVPSKITDLTKITEAKVKNAPEPETALEAFYEFIGDYPVVFHNKIFDWDRFLVPEFKTIGKNAMNYCIDTMHMGRFLHPKLSGGYGLKNLTSVYGHTIPEDEHHGALDDSRYTASLYLTMRDDMLNMGRPNSIFQDEFFEECKAAVDFDMQDFKLYRVNAWQKGKKKRLYVHTNIGVICYDFVRRVWTIPELRIEKNLSLKKCANQILKKTGAVTVDELYNNSSVA